MASSALVRSGQQEEQGGWLQHPGCFSGIPRSVLFGICALTCDLLDVGRDSRTEVGDQCGVVVHHLDESRARRIVEAHGEGDGWAWWMLLG